MSRPTRIPGATWLVAAAAGLICLLVYLKSLSCGFVNYDDPVYILNNPLLGRLDGAMLVDAFTRPYEGWWMPLTWISLAVDHRFWGVNPTGYHLTNIVLHAVNVVLVVLLADRLCTAAGIGETAVPDAGRSRGWLLLLAGLFWGMHPLRVESVAWVTERKDVLNGIFTLGALLLYLRYARIREERGGRAALHAYLLSLVLFVLSLMAKSVSVVLPAMLLVADWYPLGRLRTGNVRRMLLEKVPFLAVSVAMSMLTFYLAGQSNYLVPYAYFPFGQRLVVSGNAIFAYCRLFLWPVGIVPYRMIPDPIPDYFTVTTAVALLFCCACVVAGRKRHWVGATWAAFLLPLLPVLAFFQNGDQAYAARFTYLSAIAPSIAAAVIVVAARERWGNRGAVRYLLPGAVCALLAWHAVLTVRLIDVWKSPETFWTRVIEVDPEVIAYKERGRVYHAEGEYDAAIRDFSTAIDRVTGGFRDTVYNLYAFRGESYRAKGDYRAAVRDFTAAISMLPDPTYYYHRGLALEALGMAKEAAEDFARAGDEQGPIVWIDRR